MMHLDPGNPIPGRFESGGQCAMSSFDADRDQGNALYMQGRNAEAVECYRRALRQRPDDVDALNNLGAALANLGRLADAASCYEQALRLQPDKAEVYYNYANALRISGRYPEAIRLYAQAVRYRPEMPEGHNNLAISLRRQGRLAEAMISARRALELRPGYPTALVNLGLSLVESGHVAEGLVCYDEAIRRDPENADAHHDRAQAWLLVGDWERGWAEYEWRWRSSEFTPLGYRQPKWDGTPLAGRRILLHTEQGFGDAIHFVRYARLVKERGGRVFLAAAERLHALLRTAPGIDRMVPLPHTQPLPEFDVYCPLMSLPALFGATTTNVPADIPYLQADPERVERWRHAIAPYRGLRVGIAWQGSPSMLPHDLWRSIPLARFEPLARVEDVCLISLQRGAGVDQLAALGGKFPVVDVARDFDETPGVLLDTAAVMKNLDLVITCDTSIGHLAGALGVPVWIALQAVPAWRWLLDGEDTAWYPTARLFRQILFGSWDQPFRRMAGALRKLVHDRAAGGL
jgi:Flp pilus assembly protein TadD